MAKILITGWLGYIGAHTAVVLTQEWFDVILLDNLSNSSLTTLNEIEEITGKKLPFYETDIRDIKSLDKVFSENRDIDWVIHLAALKSVGESCEKPYEYYDININGTIRLLYTMNRYNISKIVFSSTAAVYDNKTNIPPFIENDKKVPINPYATTKLIVEQILSDVAEHKYMNSVSLRYFNVIGAHTSGLIGDAQKKKNNLLPIIFSAMTENTKMNVYGKDYDTEDGTAVRDYIHVMDIAKAHLHAFSYLETFEKTQEESQHHELVRGMNEVFNIGTSEGTSVLEMIKLVENVTGKKVAYNITERREGDAGVVIANPKKAKNILGWVPDFSIHQAIEDHWNFVTKHM